MPNINYYAFLVSNRNLILSVLVNNLPFHSTDNEHVYSVNLFFLMEIFASSVNSSACIVYLSKQSVEDSGHLKFL